MPKNILNILCLKLRYLEYSFKTANPGCDVIQMKLIIWKLDPRWRTITNVDVKYLENKERYKKNFKGSYYILRVKFGTMKKYIANFF